MQRRSITQVTRETHITAMMSPQGGRETTLMGPLWGGRGVLDPQGLPSEERYSGKQRFPPKSAPTHCPNC